ncbi:hypothetical protein PWEIH_11745 [Listeria weihenstephanensis FSL R9-0317]|uniref:hypothetical protein n=1 Tax=Listeria weihenstephanensis TaxID=1006155 RepID=UPI0003E8C302|nr:hypothetical protein [Listeria weihenstephanensis]EUJ36828.1 hypothetical protein PWEIH_11745 [Listeria weihenstephanensis FSL R9-0317]
MRINNKSQTYQEIRLWIWAVAIVFFVIYFLITHAKPLLIPIGFGIVLWSRDMFFYWKRKKT